MITARSPRAGNQRWRPAGLRVRAQYSAASEGLVVTLVTIAFIVNGAQLAPGKVLYRCS